MTVPSNTFKTYEAIGNREDLSDIIYNISPEETPFMSNAKKGTATSTYHEWQSDAFTPAAGNANLEGDDTTAAATTPTIRYGNYTQILKESARVSDTQSSMNSAGRANEMSYQVALKSKKLKRDLEISLLGTQGAVAGSAGVARELAGFGTWCWQNAHETGAVDTLTVATVTSGAPTTDVVKGTGEAFDEADLKAALALCWDEGGDPNMVLAGSVNKQLMSTFSGIATQYRDNVNAAPATIIGAADVYISDFGQVNIVASRDMEVDVVYVVDMNCVSVDYLRGFNVSELAKTGDSTIKQIVCEATLRVDSPFANAIIGRTL
jgi:hypothetical protein